jgi:hypothetical protein
MIYDLRFTIYALGITHYALSRQSAAKAETRITTL